MSVGITKVCSKCGVRKPIGEFVPCSRTRNGVTQPCKACYTTKMRRYMRKWRRGERVPRKSRYEMTPTSAATTKNPKKAARERVRYALREGILERPDACSSCGVPGPEAHHEDYTRPLDVTWLCRACHAALHAARRRSARG